MKERRQRLGGYVGHIHGPNLKRTKKEKKIVFKTNKKGEIKIEIKIIR
jgi:hypothetical protein